MFYVSSHLSYHIFNYYTGSDGTKKQKVHYERKHRQNFPPKMLISCNVVMGHCREIYKLYNFSSFTPKFLILGHTLIGEAFSKYFKHIQVFKSKSISDTFFRSILKHYLKYFKVSVFVFKIYFQVFLEVLDYTNNQKICITVMIKRLKYRNDERNAGHG